MQININVGSDIMYVGGTVNGIKTLFDGIDGHTFTADVAQSADDRYVLDLQLVDEAGNTSEYKDTFKYILPFFVYDRTQADVDRVKELNRKYLDGTITDEEKQEWGTGINGKLGLKGAFNLSDIQRIENNTQIIGKIVAAPVNVKTWEYGDIPRVSDYRRIRQNVQKIKEAFLTHADTPEVPGQPLNTYQKWNDIEKILHDVYYIYVRLKNSYYYCGTEMYAGEGIGDL